MNKRNHSLQRKATHRLAESNDYGTRFAMCGQVSSERSRLDGVGPIIVPSIPFKHAENQCLKCVYALRDKEKRK